MAEKWHKLGKDATKTNPKYKLAGKLKKNLKKKIFSAKIGKKVFFLKKANKK